MNAYRTLVLHAGRGLEGYTITARSLADARRAASALEVIHSCLVIITDIHHGAQ